MLRPQGYITVVGERPQMIERDSVQCGHCQRIVIVKPGTSATVYQVQDASGHWHEEPGAFCRMCMRAVCLQCHDIGTCTPFERRIEIAEKAGRWLELP